MIGFGWVRIYLGDVFSREYMFFIVFLVRFVEKGPKTANSGQCQGSFAAAKDPHAVARPRRRIFPSLGSPQRSHCSQHGNVVFLFHFVFPLFRRLVYGTNKDPISV